MDVSKSSQLHQTSVVFLKNFAFTSIVLYMIVVKPVDKLCSKAIYYRNYRLTKTRA